MGSGLEGWGPSDSNPEDAGLFAQIGAWLIVHFLFNSSSNLRFPPHLA